MIELMRHINTSSQLNPELSPELASRTPIIQSSYKVQMIIETPTTHR